MKTNKYFFIICLLIIFGCTKAELKNNEGLEIYLLDQISDNKLNSLEQIKLADKPLIAFDDIQSYDWKNHELFINEIGWKKVKEKITMKSIGACSTNGLPFVMTIDKKPIYIGFFRSLTFCEKSKGPAIFLENLQKGLLIISDEGFKNIVANSELHDFLVKSKKIKNDTR
jgi:hypothetical protein